MIIVEEKNINMSINLDSDEKLALEQSYQIIDLIDDKIRDNCEGDVAEFIEKYCYGNTLTFMHMLLANTSNISSKISEYINRTNNTIID